MWQEARKQEKKIRGMMVDYRRRAERRKDYYEKIKLDPAQFLQIHGRSFKIHLDPQIAASADSPATMMPWQGLKDILIDRFDVRAHLDHILPYKGQDGSDYESDHGEKPVEEPKFDKEEDAALERHSNYERYRILVQNDFLGVPEGKFLHQIYMEEHYGSQKSIEEEKKALASKKTAIGFHYDDSSEPAPPAKSQPNAQTAPEEEDSEEEFDLDLTVAVDQITTDQMHEINFQARKYGLGSNEFMTFLTKELDEQEELRQVKEEQREKAMYSGRKARRERRAFREKRLLLRRFSPPSYASRASPTYNPYPQAEGKSKSPSPELEECEEKIQYITSFGGDSEEEKKKAAVQKASSVKKTQVSSSRVRRRSRSHSRSRKRSRSRSRSRKYRSRSRDRRSRSKHRHRSRQRSRSRRGRRRSYSRSRSRSRSTSRRTSHKHRNKRSRSRSPSRMRPSKQKSRTRSRTPTIPTKIAPAPIPVQQPVTIMVPQRAPTPPPPPQVPPPPIRKYYGARKGSSSEEDSDFAEDKDKISTSTKSIQAKKPTTSVANSSNSSNECPTKATTTKLTPQERLKRKLQAALNKQFKADKKAERSKVEKAEQERMDREEELKELAIKLRRKERYRRHQRFGDSRDSSSSRHSSRSGSPNSGTRSRSPLREPLHSSYSGNTGQRPPCYPPPLPSQQQTAFSGGAGSWNPTPLPPPPTYQNYNYDNQGGFHGGYPPHQPPQHPYHNEDDYAYYGEPSGPN